MGITCLVLLSAMQWQRMREFGPDKNKLIKGRSQISEELFFIVLV